jgi:trimeric autotransporter adhesin
MTVASGTFVDAIAFEARGREGVGSRPGRSRVGVLVAAVLLVVVAVVVAAALVGVRAGASSARSSAPPSAGGFARLPVPLRGVVSGTLGRSDRVFWVRRAGAGFVVVNGGQGFSARFSGSGVRVAAGAGSLALSLAGVGYGSSLRPLAAGAPSGGGNRVSYADGPVTEWFENGPLGLEQGFTLRPPPAGAARGPVTIALRVGGSFRARVVGGGAAADFVARGGRVVLRYVGLRAVDARGRVLHAWLAVTGGGLLVRVDARGARYPLRIDPFVQQGSKLVGTGAVGDAGQGVSVALAGDGNTAIVGGPYDKGARASYTGAAWVFTRSDGTWTLNRPGFLGGPIL